MGQRLVHILSVSLALMGCSMITEPPPADSRIACTQIGFTSQISISIQSASVLPEYMSASINDSVLLDECTSGSASRYTFRRHNDHNATLTLFAYPGSPIAALFLNDDGSPKSEVDLNAQVYGHESCEDDDVQVASIQKPLKWVPIYANGEGCGLDGYSGF